MLTLFHNQRMYIHAFVFHWKPRVTEDQKNQAVEQIKGLQGKIPGLLETYVGKNGSRHAVEYEHGGVMKFSDQAALDAYGSHPAHQELLQWLMPLIDPVELDFPV